METLGKEIIRLITMAIQSWPATLRLAVLLVVASVPLFAYLHLR